MVFPYQTEIRMYKTELVATPQCLDNVIILIMLERSSSIYLQIWRTILSMVFPVSKQNIFCLVCLPFPNIFLSSLTAQQRLCYLNDKQLAFCCVENILEAQMTQQRIAQYTFHFSGNKKLTSKTSSTFNLPSLANFYKIKENCHTSTCTSFGNLPTYKIFFIPDIYLTFFWKIFKMFQTKFFTIFF